MTTSETVGAPWPDYQVTAKGLGANPENKIHTDEVARSLGFSGGLVGSSWVRQSAFIRLLGSGEVFGRRCGVDAGMAVLELAVEIDVEIRLWRRATARRLDGPGD